MTTEVRRAPAGAAVLRDDVTDAIQTALLEELAAVGYGRLSIEAVARRAGVGKTAVYRRWSSKLAMVIEVVTAVASPGLALPDMGSLVADLETLLRFAGRALRHPLASQIIPDLLAEAARNDTIGATLRETLGRYEHDIGVLLVERAVGRGELSGTVAADLAVDLVVGPLYWRVAIARGKLPDRQIKTMAVAAAAALTAVAQ